MAEFELTMQEPPRTGQRLTDFADLVGETILGAFDSKDDGEWVLVTENRNWIVLEAEEGFSRDEAADIRVKTEPYHRSGQETLADYVRPRELLDAGVINAAVFAELQAKANAAEKAEKERKAARLREALAKLEGGGA